jgi:thiamine-phosphate pyrophosphorylase
MGDALKNRLRLMAITDRRCCKAPIEKTVSDLVDGGITALMIREKDLASRELYDLALPLVALCRKKNVLTIINGAVDVALALEADGAQLGWNAQPLPVVRRLVPPHFVIGVSAHSAHEIEQASAHGADYATLSPIFAPNSKESAAPPIGLDGLQKIARNAAIPLVALGGISSENAAACIDAGAVGAAAIGALFGASAPSSAAASMRAVLGS